MSDSGHSVRSTNAATTAGVLVVLAGVLWWLLSASGCGADTVDVPVSIDDDALQNATADARQAGQRSARDVIRRESDEEPEEKRAPSGTVRVLVTDSFGRPLLDGQAAVSLDVRKSEDGARRRFLLQPIRGGVATFEEVPLGQEMIARAHAERARIGVDPSLPSEKLDPLESDGEERSVSIAVELTRPFLRIRAPVLVDGQSQPTMHLVLEDRGRGHFRAAQRPDEDGWMSVMLPERFVDRTAAAWLTLGSEASSPMTFLGDLGPLQIGANVEVYAEMLAPLVLVSGRVDFEALAREELEVGEPGDIEVRIERSSDGSRWLRIQRDFAWGSATRERFSFSWIPRHGDRHRLRLLISGGAIGEPVEFEPFETDVLLPGG